jgi:hypothetical protein
MFKVVCNNLGLPIKARMLIFNGVLGHILRENTIQLKPFSNLKKQKRETLWKLEDVMLIKYLC